MLPLHRDATSNGTPSAGSAYDAAGNAVAVTDPLGNREEKGKKREEKRTQLVFRSVFRSVRIKGSGANVAVKRKPSSGSRFRPDFDIRIRIIYLS